MAVILLRSLFATKFLSTIDLIVFFSKKSKTCVKVPSMTLCNFKARIVIPKMIPKRMKRKILDSICTLKDNRDSGRTW